MKKDDVLVHYYSERGLINCLIDWFRSDDNGIDKFLSGITLGNGEMLNKIIDIKKIKQAIVFNESSFGDFGSPDLILKLIADDDKSYILIIEAKVESFKSTASIKPKENKVEYRDNASKIDIQLFLRKRFIVELNKLKNCGEIFQKEEGYTNRNGRALKKDKLCELWFDNIKGEKFEYFYVALTKEKSDNAVELYNDYIDGRKIYDGIKMNNNEFGTIRWASLFNYKEDIYKLEEIWALTKNID